MSSNAKMYSSNEESLTVVLRDDVSEAHSRYRRDDEVDAEKIYLRVGWGLVVSEVPFLKPRINDAHLKSQFRWSPSTVSNQHHALDVM